MPFKDLIAYQPEAKTAEVSIGGQSFTVKAILDPTKILRLQEEAQGRQKLSYKDDADKPYRLNEHEVTAYLFLRDGLAEEEAVTFEEIVAISRKTSLDCLNAGMKVMELSGLIAENREQSVTDEAKND